MGKFLFFEIKVLRQISYDGRICKELMYNHCVIKYICNLKILISVVNSKEKKKDF